MSAMCDVTVILNGYPTSTLHDALTRPIIEEPTDERLGLVNAAEQAGGSKVYSGAIYAGCFNHVQMSDLEAFFRSIPIGSYGATQGIVIIDHEYENGLQANRIGYVPPPKSPTDH